MLETLDGPNHGSSDPQYPMLPYAKSYTKADMLFTGIFTFDLLLKCALAKTQKQFWTSTMTIMDILAVLPLYIISAKNGTLTFPEAELQQQGDQYIKLLRLFRIIRVVVMLKHKVGMRILYLTARDSFAPLSITLFFLITFIMLFATILYYAQPCYNVDTCTFTDIFNAGYFVMVTVATVGYGDQVPEIDNVVALFVTCVVMIFGALYLAMPLAIVGIKYELLWTRFESERKNKIRAESFKRGQPIPILDGDDLQKMQIRSTRLAPLANRLNIQFVDLCELVGQLSKDCSTFVNLVNAEKLVNGPPDRNRDDGAAKLIDTLLKVLRAHKNFSKGIKPLVPREILKPSPFMKPPSPPKPSENSPSRHSTFKQNIISRAKRALSNSQYRDDDDDDDHVQAPKSKKEISFRRRLFLLLERPYSSRQARYVNKFFLLTVIMSMLLFYAETTPELQAYGTSTLLCRRAVESYCTKLERNPQNDPGCFVYTGVNKTTSILLDFQCKMSSVPDANNQSPCYGVGWNYGSTNSYSQCSTSFSDIEKICNLRQCQNDHEPMFDMTDKWIFLESYFAFVFTVEWLLRLYASKRRGAFIRSFGTWMDIFAITPYYTETIMSLIRGLPPVYATVPTFPTFVSVLPITKALRIFKLARHIRSTTVLARTAQLTYQRLMLPLFFLFLGCICSGAIFYEIERGTQCLARLVCSWWNLDIMTQEIGNQFPEGKRIQIQVDKLTIVTDMLRSTWLSIVTFTTVGYGDMKPRTPFGKLLDIIAMVCGSCYTAMPLSLIGGQFYSCYAQFLRERGDKLKRGTSTGVATDTDIDDVIEKRQRRRSIIGTIEAPMLNQFMALTRLLNEVILNTCRLNAMALQPAKLGNSGLPLSPILDTVVHGAEKTVQQVRRLSSAPRKGSKDSGLMNAVRTVNAMEQKIQAAEAIVNNIATACTMAQTIVLNFSFIVEKVVIEDQVPVQSESARRASCVMIATDSKNGLNIIPPPPPSVDSTTNAITNPIIEPTPDSTPDSTPKPDTTPDSTPKPDTTPAPAPTSDSTSAVAPEQIDLAS